MNQRVKMYLGKINGIEYEWVDGYLSPKASISYEDDLGFHVVKTFLPTFKYYKNQKPIDFKIREHVIFQLDTETKKVLIARSCHPSSMSYSDFVHLRAQCENCRNVV